MRREGTVISCPGRRVELIPWPRNRATALGIDPTVIAVAENPHMSAACQAADGAVGVPPCDRPDFIDGADTSAKNVHASKAVGWRSVRVGHPLGEHSQAEAAASLDRADRTVTGLAEVSVAGLLN